MLANVHTIQKHIPGIPVQASCHLERSGPVLALMDKSVAGSQEVCVACGVASVSVGVVWCGVLSSLRCCMSIVVWWVVVAGCVSVVWWTKRNVTSTMGSKNDI